MQRHTYGQIWSLKCAMHTIRAHNLWVYFATITQKKQHYKQQQQQRKPFPTEEKTGDANGNRCFILCVKQTKLQIQQTAATDKRVNNNNNET